jgi:hypothetical protein
MRNAHQEEKADNSGHQNTIIINGRSVVVSQKELTFDEVVALSGLATGPDITFTITFRRGHGEKAEGSMVENGDPIKVKVKVGMIFNVDPTTRS